jgi:hypothetical protein
MTSSLGIERACTKHNSYLLGKHDAWCGHQIFGHAELFYRLLLRRRRATDNGNSSAIHGIGKTNDVLIDVAPCLVLIGVPALQNALRLQI